MSKKSCTYILLTLLMCCFALTGCGHKHTWEDADCITPKTCTKCDEIEGEALGHAWIDATYETPKICNTCGETDGTSLKEYIPIQIEKFDTRTNIDYIELKDFVEKCYAYLDDEQIEIVGIAIASCKIEDFVADLIKGNMKNPSSFELVSFDPGYILKNSDGSYGSIIEITFRGTNSFGAVVPETMKGMIDFDVNFDNCTISYKSSLFM